MAKNSSAPTGTAAAAKTATAAAGAVATAAKAGILPKILESIFGTGQPGTETSGIFKDADQARIYAKRDPTGELLAELSAALPHDRPKLALSAYEVLSFGRAIRRERMDGASAKQLRKRAMTLCNIRAAASPQERALRLVGKAARATYRGLMRTWNQGGGPGQVSLAAGYAGLVMKAWAWSYVIVLMLLIVLGPFARGSLADPHPAGLWPAYVLIAVTCLNAFIGMMAGVSVGTAVSSLALVAGTGIEWVKSALSSLLGPLGFIVEDFVQEYHLKKANERAEAIKEFKTGFFLRWAGVQVLLFNTVLVYSMVLSLKGSGMAASAAAMLAAVAFSALTYLTAMVGDLKEKAKLARLNVVFMMAMTGVGGLVHMFIGWIGSSKPALAVAAQASSGINPVRVLLWIGFAAGLAGVIASGVSIVRKGIGKAQSTIGFWPAVVSWGVAMSCATALMLNHPFTTSVTTVTTGGQTATLTQSVTPANGGKAPAIHQSLVVTGQQTAPARQRQQPQATPTPAPTRQQPQRLPSGGRTRPGNGELSERARERRDRQQQRGEEFLSEL